MPSSNSILKNREETLELLASGEIAIPTLQVTQDGISVDFLDLNLTFDETGEDFITATIFCPPQVDYDVLKAPVFRIVAGYVFPNLQTESVNLLDIHLVARHIENSQEFTKISLQSYESRIRDAGASSNRAYTSADDTTAVLTQIIKDTLPGSVVLSDLVQPLPFLVGDEVLQWKSFPNPWGIIQEIADNVEATVYHDGVNFRIITPKNRLENSSYIASLDQVKEANLVRNREAFANSVITRSDQIEVRVDQTTGPYAVSAIGRKVYIDQLPHPLSTAQARRRATSLLSRKISSGNTFNARLSVMPLSLLPGETVTVYTRDSSWKGILTAVSFDFAASSAVISLRNLERN